MTSVELKSVKELPKNHSALIQAMWHDYQGNWEASHNLAQDVNTRDGAWVHAYLHRKEGDQSNAGYWYRQARRNMPSTTLEAEWEEIATALLDKE